MEHRGEYNNCISVAKFYDEPYSHSESGRDEAKEKSDLRTACWNRSVCQTRRWRAGIRRIRALLSCAESLKTLHVQENGCTRAKRPRKMKFKGLRYEIIVGRSPGLHCGAASLPVKDSGANRIAKKSSWGVVDDARWDAKRGGYQ
jgi:hypothetical protein